ncbi:MAG: ABC transporter ATP-binding protein [Candidatus Baltobacteraceae bacterium]
MNRRGAALRIEDVAVRYEGTDRNAVDGVSLDVPAAELVVLLGPSGCGKSTLLRTVNRLVTPFRGSVWIEGRDVRDVEATALRRGIGYVIQAIGLFPHMNVAANVAIVPQLLGWDRSRVAARVDELLTLVRLDPVRYRARLPRELSGGEAQRVGVARALAAQPPLLLMDEPFGAVDALVRSALQDELARIHRVLGTTILFVTHDVDEALRLADRLVVMNDGRIVQYDTPLRVLGRPATPFVEALLDARDGVRRLGLLRVRDAMRATGGDAGDATIEAGRTLREALSAFLDGARVLAVRDGERTVGTLCFDDVRAAIVAAA